MNWIIKLFTGREFMPLTSYDDMSFSTLDYHYERVMEWVKSCKDFSQMKAMDTAIKLFRKMYPAEHAKAQHLYRMYWKLKRDFIINN